MYTIFNTPYYYPLSIKTKTKSTNLIKSIDRKNIPTLFSLRDNSLSFKGKRYVSKTKPIKNIIKKTSKGKKIKSKLYKV